MSAEATPEAVLFAMARQPSHFLVITGYGRYGEIELSFKCEAPADSTCRLRPADGREEWTYDDADLVDSGKCWAEEWIAESGIEEGLSADCDGPVEYARIPVTVSYGECVEVAPFPTPPNDASHALVNLSQWIDASNADRDSEAVTWGRIAKLMEEGGEAVAAFIGYTGQNPRKGVTHTRDDLEKELLDSAITALGAIEHLRGHDGRALELLNDAILRVAARASSTTEVTA